MITRLEANLKALSYSTSIKPLHADACQLAFQPASLICLNFTLQFIPREDRLPFLTKLHQALLPNGALILSEKIHFSDPEEELRIRKWHHQFKHANGYSWLEIEQKAAAIQEMMPTDTLEEHQKRLHKAGFSRITVWHRSFSFLSLVAEP